MSENNYECPKCHNVFPSSNRFMHDLRCTASKPLPLNQSRLVGNNQNNKQNREPIQHRPQPIITRRKRNNNYINPLNIKESVFEVPKTFNCWLCGQTFPENQKEDHMICHQMQEENDNFRKKQEQERKRNQQNQQKPFERPPQRPQQQQSPPQQQRPPQQQPRPPHQQQRPPQQQNNNRGPQRNNNNNNNNIINRMNMKRSFIPFDDIDIFDFNQIHESLNKMNNPTDEDILNELPETEIGDISKLEANRKNCVICLIDFKCGDKATMLPCIHMFHTNCIQSWLKSNNICPVCKFKLTENNLV